MFRAPAQTTSAAASAPASSAPASSSSSTTKQQSSKGTSSAAAVNPKSVLKRASEPAQPSPPVASTSKPTVNASKRQRTAPSQPAPVPEGPPKLSFSQTANVHTPLATRQKMLDSLYTAYVALYGELADQSHARRLAGKHALAEENTVYASSNRVTYRNAVIQTLARLKKRDKPRRPAETGTLNEVAQRAKAQEERQKGHMTFKRLEPLLASKQTLIDHGYVVDVPPNEGGVRKTEEGNVRVCERCGTGFTVHAKLSAEDKSACRYHWGRLRVERVHGIKQRVYSCCPAADAPPCQVGPHIFRDDEDDAMHAVKPYKTSLEALGRSPGAVELAALDCEMIYTTSGSEVARVSVVGEDGVKLLDEYVRTQGAVLDTNVRFSGIQPETLEKKAVLDLAGTHKALAQVCSSETILIGHGLENDLKALRLVHDRVLDTAILFPHPRGLPIRYALRVLAQDKLGRFVQDGDPSHGHDPLEDARTALELVRFKITNERVA